MQSHTLQDIYAVTHASHHVISYVHTHIIYIYIGIYMYVACLQYVYTLYRYSDTNMCVCMYVCLDVHDVCILYIYIYIHCVCLLFSIHAASIRVSTYRPTYLHTYPSMHRFTCVSICSCIKQTASARTCMYTYMHTCASRCMRVYIYTRHTHTHTHVRALFFQKTRVMFTTYGSDIWNSFSET